MKYPEQGNLQRQKADWCLLAGEGRGGEIVLEMDKGGGFTT